MACFTYEGVLLFGVVMIAGYLYSSLTQQRHALDGRAGLQAFLFVVLAIYFVWFWSRGGQTVAMKAWHIQLQSVQGQPLSQRRALVRYLASWLWFAPALFVAQGLAFRSGSEFFGLLFAWTLLYALLSFALPGRQFLHDFWCGTRLVHKAPPGKEEKA
jgi:uncharacterized RDD family membrane protein YckC